MYSCLCVCLWHAGFILCAHSFGPVQLARCGLPTSESGRLVEAARRLCSGLFHHKEQGPGALWEGDRVSGNHVPTSTQTGSCHQTHEDHVWPQDHGREIRSGPVSMYRNVKWGCFFVNVHLLVVPVSPSRSLCGCSKRAGEWLTPCQKSASSSRANSLSTKTSV